MEKLKNIPINIWDDFKYSDGTYAYIENHDISHDVQEKCLNILYDFLLTNHIISLENMKLIFYDSKSRYDDNTIKRNIEYYGEDFFYKRWQINLKKISQSKLRFIIDQLQVANIMYNNIPFKIYSES